MDDLDPEPSPKDLEAIKDAVAPKHEAWGQTLDEMYAMANDLREDGWTVVAIPTAHTDPIAPEHGPDPDRFGLVHVIPGNYQDEFVDLYEPERFTSYEVYQREIDQAIYQVTALYDTDTRSAILLGVYYERARANELFQAVPEEGVMFTHCKKLDGTPLGTFRHDDYEPMIPQTIRP